MVLDHGRLVYSQPTVEDCSSLCSVSLKDDGLRDIDATYWRSRLLGASIANGIVEMYSVLDAVPSAGRHLFEQDLVQANKTIPIKTDVVWSLSPYSIYVDYDKNGTYFIGRAGLARIAAVPTAEPLVCSLGQSGRVAACFDGETVAALRPADLDRALEHKRAKKSGFGHLGGHLPYEDFALWERKFRGVRALAGGSNTLFVGAESEIALYDLEKDQVILRHRDGPLVSHAVVRDDPLEALAWGKGEDEKPRLWRFRAGAGTEELPVAGLYEGSVHTMALSRDQRRLWLGFEDGILQEVDLDAQPPVITATTAIGARIDDLLEHPEQPELYCATPFGIATVDRQGLG